MEELSLFLENYENFDEEQKALLERFVTNTSKHIFCLRNLPEVIKGALFSRYSRSTLGLRALLLKEFISNDEESAFAGIAGSFSQEDTSLQTEAIRRAQSFYDRILDGYGDDSIGELGGAHIAIENVSMLAAKVIEDCRIGGSPLEKSTRYIYFDQKWKGQYLFYREPVLMTSAYRDLYLNTCNHLFDVYGQLIPPLTAIIEKQMPQEAGVPERAYKAALRAKVLDCLRGLLPAGTLTNMGVYGNGRFFEGLLHKMHCHRLAEMQEVGKSMQEELAKIIPSFVRRGAPSHKTHATYEKHQEAMRARIKEVTVEHANFPERSLKPGVRMVEWDSNAETKVAAAILYEQSNKGYEELKEYCNNLSTQEISEILDTASFGRENRRHKSPRALEHAEFTFEIVADFGAYRDLHRHRILTQERQLLSCDYGYYTPDELIGTELELTYRHALEKAKTAYEQIAKEFPEEAQYVVPMAYNVRWYFHVNLRALQWICELRSQAAGHPTYRYIAQEMAQQVMDRFPEFKRFFGFVDFAGHDLGRLGQEIRKEGKVKQDTEVLKRV